MHERDRRGEVPACERDPVAQPQRRQVGVGDASGRRGPVLDCERGLVFDRVAESREREREVDLLGRIEERLVVAAGREKRVATNRAGAAEEVRGRARSPRSSPAPPRNGHSDDSTRPSARVIRNASAPRCGSSANAFATDGPSPLMKTASSSRNVTTSAAASSTSRLRPAVTPRFASSRCQTTPATGATGGSDAMSMTTISSKPFADASASASSAGRLRREDAQRGGERVRRRHTGLRAPSRSARSARSPPSP